MIGRQQSWWVLGSMCVSLVAACAEADLADVAPNESVPRTEVKRPNDPTTDAGLPYDLGTDMDMTTSIPVDADMASDPDMTGPEDMTPDLDPQDPCAGKTLCQIGTSTCDGARLRSCVLDPAGCSVYGGAVDCPSSMTCQQGQCRTVTTCVDNDGDGYGTNCQLGPDCRDNDPQIHPGAQELCDGVDNNCNNLVDEGFPNVGQSCTSSGQGACATQGTYICGANGQVVCDAVPGTPATEICDGLDNDCNGVVDDNMVCPVPSCANDPQEPNDTQAQAFSLNVNSPVLGLTCAVDKEFFKLNVTPNKTYRINLAFPHSRSDLDLVLYDNGAAYRTADSASDHEQLQFTAQAGHTYTVEVKNYGARDNFYRLSVVDSWACSDDDAFEKNDAISSANYLVPGWTMPAFLCTGNRDFYYLGELDASKTITVDIFYSLSFFLGEGNLDLALYGDDDGDGTFDLLRSATTAYDDERLTYTTTYRGRYAVMVYGRDYALDDADNDYDIRWSVTP